MSQTRGAFATARARGTQAGTIVLATAGRIELGKHAEKRAEFEAKYAEWLDSGRQWGEPTAPQRPEVFNARVATIPIALMLVVSALFSVSIVDARAVGIQTSLGKYAGTLDSGLHFVAPWSSVEEFSTRIETHDIKGDGAVTATLQGGGIGTFHASARWAILDDASEAGAKALWESYRDYDTVRDSLVDRELRDVLQNVANDFTPNEARTSQDKIAERVVEVAKPRLAKYGVSIESFSVLAIDLDPATQASLDKIVAAQNDVERAKQEKLRAETDNETAKLRAASGALSGGSLTRYCLEIVNSWDTNKNGTLPATFNCGMGGAGASVLVGAK